MLRRWGLVAALAALIAFVPVPASSDTDPAVVAWMKRAGHPFDTCAPVNDDRDLKFLDTLVGDARVVALGEGTHGTSEFFQMKHRIVRYLATHLGFTVFAIEANMPEAQRVNDYVMTGRGDPRALLDGMYFWTWNTQEVLDMIEWMRAFNASGKGRIEFTGFDMQLPDTAAAIAHRTLVHADPAAAESLQACVLRLQQARPGQRSGSFRSSSAALPVADFAGHHVRYSGWIKTEDVPVAGFAGLWMRADSGATSSVAFDNMANRQIRGTRSWQRYAFELDIPKGTTNLYFGMLLSGGGQAWFDSLRIERDGSVWQSDSLDLALEAADTPGFPKSTSEGWEIRTDDSVAHAGVRSLSIRRLGPSAPQQAPSPAMFPLESVQRLLAHLEQTRDRLARATSPSEADWTIQNVRVVEQCTRMGAAGPAGTSAVRDSSMAANVEWLLAHHPKGTRIVLWAHNAHVSRHPNWMGSHLARVHGRDLRVFGFTAYSGTYTAMKANEGLVSTNELVAPAPENLEAYAHATGWPRFVLDVRAPGPDSAAARFLGSPRWMRGIGAVAQYLQFTPTNLPYEYDAIVYVDSTRATKLMHAK